jgi:hypothetical protein
VSWLVLLLGISIGEIIDRCQFYAELDVPGPRRQIADDLEAALAKSRVFMAFRPNSNHRAQVTPTKRGKVKKLRSLDEGQTPADCRAAMTWAQRLKRVFNIDIETCHVTLLLHRITRQGCLRACGRNWCESQWLWAVIQY